MPRGRKSKLRAREKCQETHGQPQGLTGPQATAEKQEESHSSSSSSQACLGTRRRSSDVSVPQEFQGVSPTGSPDAVVSCSKSDVAAKAQDEKSASTSLEASIPQESQGASHTGSPDAGVSYSKSDVAVKGQDEKSPSTSPDASITPEFQGASPTGFPDADVSGSKYDVAAKGQDEESVRASQKAINFKRISQDPLKRKAYALVQFLQKKFEKKEPILKADMLKRIGKRYKHCFPEILNRTSESLVVAFGVELKEMDSCGESYTFVSKLGLSSEGILSGANGLQKSGLLMSVLAVIFMKGNSATEEEVWESLSGLGIYAGMTHTIYGDPQKLLTEDLVQDKYVVYRQVPNSDPPRYEFLWGPRAHAETTKMRFLRVLAEINKSSPGLYPHLYEDALMDEVERALRLRD
ncbi:PREDICTED: melanoma-associated antigen B6-like [Colobus angolensis palliatus]|uniref:melanoma-associated antigen B6-like n=1 Tax=Colobus angolensis palliatus TaxID=336983 RepID=UPI0005F4410A|nr:PREDICTED: melanoma-associated antigen B6-like [Colobus angolensis palliatus]